MYAIVTNVTSPPRTSRPQVEPRLVISKKRSTLAATPDSVDGAGAGV
jgi:hypothetical protein